MAKPAYREPSYDDILALPRGVTGQILFGVLHTSPRPAPKHAQAATTLGEELGPPFKRGRGGPGGWLILYEPEVHLNQHIVVPDLAGWRRETMPEMPVDKAYFVLAPDWVCEVLSPSTRALDRGQKLRVYAEHGVGFVWFVEPLEQLVEVLELDGATYRIVDSAQGDVAVRLKPFDAIEFPLGALWQR